MSELPMKQEDHPAHNMPDPTESYSGDTSDPYYTAKNVNVGPKSGQIEASPYPNTDDNRFFASGRDEKIISAKRKLRDGMQ